MSGLSEIYTCFLNYQQSCNKFKGVFKKKKNKDLIYKFQNRKILKDKIIFY